MYLRAAVLVIWASVLVTAYKCPSTIRPPSEMCCHEQGLGCFKKEKPFTGMPLPCCPENDDVDYFLYTKTNKDSYQHIKPDGKLPSAFHKGRMTVFVIHGWMSSTLNSWVIDMKNSLLRKADYNVILVDWNTMASFNYYPTSASSTRTVGALTGKIIAKLVKEGKADPQKIWCIGHSLGAHHCGHAAMKNGPIARVTGLDPAGPYFEGERDLKVGLNPSCASFVDVIHSDTKGSVNKYGTTRPIGHMDFYPNGLGKQPGCRDRRRRSIQPHGSMGCSHGRAIDYFIESIQTDCFIAKLKCTDINNMPGSCTKCSGKNGKCAAMGFSARSSGSAGIYYLETSGKFPPHCMA